MFAVVRKSVKGSLTPVVVEVESVCDQRRMTRSGVEFVRLRAVGSKSEKYARPEWSAFEERSQAEAVLEEAKDWYAQFDLAQIIKRDTRRKTDPTG